MDLGHAVAHAAIHGLSTALPISASGHRVAARIWLGDEQGLEALAVIADLGCWVAFALVVRSRLFRAFTEGLRGIARPAVLSSTEGGRDALALVLAALVASGTDLALRPLASQLNDTPTLAGVGLLLSAAALASTFLAPPPRHMAPAPLGAMLVGLAYGMAQVPGASRVGAAFVVLRWLGIGGWRAAEGAMMVAVPVMALEGARALFDHPDLGALTRAQIPLVFVLALVSASLAASWWKALCERGRAPWLGLWLVPLSLAVIGYGRALPDPLRGIDPAAIVER